MPKRAQIISPDAYPALMPKGVSGAVARMLRSPEMAERGAKVLEQQGESLRQAVLELVGNLENAGQDHGTVAAAAHEIRGLAGSAGLASAGRIAEGLCRYYDQVAAMALRPDGAIVELHVSAIARAARHQDEASRMSDKVAKELAVLVQHKLTEINTLRSS